MYRMENVMRYKTENELDNFKFADTHIQFVEYRMGSFIVVADNVTICANNSCNRDIRDMRANNMGITINNAVITSFIKEGYKEYDPDGRLIRESQDEEVDTGDYESVIKSMEDGWLYTVNHKDNYEFIIDTDDSTYAVTVKGDSDTEEWDRFLNLE